MHGVPLSFAPSSNSTSYLPSDTSVIGRLQCRFNDLAFLKSTQDAVESYSFISHLVIGEVYSPHSHSFTSTRSAPSFREFQALNDHTRANDQSSRARKTQISTHPPHRQIPTHNLIK
ncbi:hypothetical protein AN958_02070 [Leucoagaricus sp. SymC.cos]|nr:hypothetical protein AN958_02070 [Leucoagaricus sp. SymC.cos]